MTNPHGSDFSHLLSELGSVSRFQEFQNLMRFRVREILLVSSLYDSFILFHQLHLPCR
jgi:hypothetical protein